MIGMVFLVFTDGGARGNPGSAAVGVVIKDEQGKTVHQFGKKIGETTNNVAEYTAVIEALAWIKNNLKDPLHSSGQASSKFQFFLDSRLVVNQLNGLFKIKESHLRELLLKIRELEAGLGGNISYQLIPREKNWSADRLVNQALDS